MIPFKKVKMIYNTQLECRHGARIENRHAIHAYTAQYK